ncbi:MAG TPA: TlpA disulfide reductase family protein [Chitinophagales bacterium]|nr:TlpA disulfide reductase family protein [Chitinophagales bacterium]
MNTKAIKAVLLVVLLLVGGYLYNKYRIAPTVAFNALQLVDGNEQPVTLSAYKGQPLLVSFFATWCGPCVHELPSLVQAQQLLHSTNVRVVLISDENNALLNRVRMRYPGLTVLHSVKELPELDIATIPTTYLLNSKHEDVYKKVGEEDWGSADMITKLQQLLAEN